MAEPTLSELGNLRVDSALGTGTPAVIYDSRGLYQRLDNAQQEIAKNKQEKYKQFLGNLKDIYKGIGDTAQLDIMTQDRPVLQKQMADLFSKIEKDPRAVLGGQGFAELQQGLAKLKFDSTESAKNNLFDKAHREFLARDPDLNTPENKGKIEAFGDQPLGSRKAFELDMPGLFDPATLAKTISGAIKKDFATSKLSEDGKFIESFSGTQYPEEQYNAIAGNYYDMPDPRSGSLRNTIQQRFKNLPPQIQAKYKDAEDPAKAYYMDLMKPLRPQDQLKKAGEKANPYEQMDKRQMNAVALEGLKEGNREKLAAVRAKLGLTDLAGNSDFLVRQYAGIIGNTTGKARTVKEGGKNVVEDEINIPSNILKYYAQSNKESLKEGTSLDPISETIISGNQPDVQTRTSNGDLRLIFYKHYNKGDAIPAGKNVGDPVVNKDGDFVIENKGVIPKRNLLTVLGKGVVSSKLLTTAIDVADDKLKGKDNSYIDKVNKGEETDEKPKSDIKPTASFSIKGKNYSKKQLNDLGYTDDQIQQAIKMGTIKNK